MVINRGDIKRKRKDDDSERIILEESRKRTKVHAQRKFAQGSNVNSPVITPVITPVKELEKLDKPKPDVLPEPIELLPIKRPNTEDFLTFLCFRGTPILPPSLNFFNTASVYESGARPPEPKEETGNGPIPTSTIVRATSGSSSERPFIAFGVRKRADPIVISKQMERKRRHALTLQALRRKYEEQKMAKIRAVTISKLSERIQNKSSVRATRSISNKSEEAKESIPQKTKVKVISTKVATKPAKVALKTKIKQKMCLRSFRGRFVQCELQYKAVKKRTLPSTKVLVKKPAINPVKKKQQGLSDEFSSDDDQPLVETVNKTDIKRIKIAKKSATVVPKKPAEVNFRITRSNRRLGILPSRMQQIKQKKLFLVKMTPRITRSSQKLKNLKKIKAKTALSNNKNSVKPEDKNHTIKTEKIDPKRTEREIVKQGIDKNLQVKLERRDLKQDRKLIMEEPKNLSKKGDKKEIKIELKDIKEKIESKVTESEKKEKKDVKIEKKEVKQEVKMEKKDVKQEVKMEKQENKKEEKIKQKEVKLEAKSEDKPLKKKPDKEPDSKKDNKQEEVKVSQRPTRKTKEAAAIYMEILGHKLVHDGDNDDDSESFDSFPELPNVRKTEQRENELKAKAKFKMSSSKSETDKNKLKNKNTGDLNKAKCKELVNKPDVNKQKCKEPVNKLDAKVKCKEIGKVEVNKSKSKESVEKNDAKIKCKESIDKQKGDQNDQKLSKEAKNIKLAVAKPVVNIEKKVFDHLLKDLVKTDDKEKDKKEEKATKTKALKKTEEEEIPKRQTRQSQNKNVSESDSDESFYADVKIPRLQRKSVRNKRPKSYRSFSDSESSVDSPKIEKTSKSVINASDDNEKVLTSSKVKTNLDKKETKVESFSDSDEEPLSKLTKKDEDLKNNVKKDEFVENEPEKKPKRECTKRPQNYLTSLFSSSDDEDGKYFLGFVEKDAKDVKNAKLLENNLFSSADLLCKDVGRRFGKGKVNMSNEQIEKWLKDSALAGTSIKKENDAMLKFGEKIPSDDLNTTSSSEKEILKMPPEVLKTSETHESKKVVETRNILDASFEKPKTQVSDRKLIFRKVKKESTPNINAFSASNESSVYAFGEENEDVISTPFRRPSRRPSSTATSKSEDEVSKIDKTLSTDKALDEASTSKVSSEGTENILSKKQGDQTVSGCNQKKTFASTPMCPPSLKLLKPVRVFEASDDIKYKIPSSPSASSSSSAKISKRATCKPRIRPLEFCLPVNAPDFPSVNEQAQVVEAPVFYPTDKEFQDPVEYIDKIRKTAEKYGICRIVPPSTFKPECKVTDDMRFTAYNQYVHKMLRRWGPNFKELMAIKKYLETQSISLTHPPWIGGMEIDLPRLYQTVQNFGGLKEVIEKKKWPKVSEAMKIPKSAQDRVTKLDDIYCKYLLPYDTLSPAEREKLFDEVETDWAKRESRNLLKAQQRVVQDEVASEIESESDDEADECIVKGRSMALNAFYRIARNTMSMWFKSTEPTAQQVEQEFWKHVMLQQNHICVHSGSIDSGNWGYGFAVSKNSPFARHAWNLKVMTNNSGSVLRSMGPIMGVTVPTLHVGMVFSACCWYRDPHRLPWIEYLHTGGNKIWYGIPDSASEVFRLAVMKLVPNYCRNKTLWLPSDTAMVPPSLLVENGVSLCRTVQEPGQFVVIFPKAFTSSISTGYVVSESVYFAPPYWLNTAQKVFDELRNSCEPSMFSLDRLIISISNDSRSNVEVLKQILPALEQLHAKEKKNRDKLKDLGVVTTEKLPLPDAKKRKKLQGEDYECEICRTNLFVSMAMECQEEGVYCIEHAIEKIEHKKIQSKYVKLMFTYSEEELQSLVVKVRISIENKSVKKIPGKYAGMPTLLK